MERPLRICFVALQFPPDIGGSQSRTEKQARQLQALGHHVTVLTARLRKQWLGVERRDGLPVVRVGGLYKRGGELRTGRLGIWPVSVGVLWNLWRRRRQFDVIHVMQLSPLAAMAALVGMVAQKPVVISIQSTGPSAEERARLRAEERARLLRDATFLDDVTDMRRFMWCGAPLLSLIRKSHAIYQVLSTRGHSYLAAYGFRTERIVHISGSVDTARFRPNPERRPDPSGPERVIVCVTRLDYQKGVDVLLHAWGRLMHAPVEWRGGLVPRLQVVGDGPLRSQLERLAVELGLAGSVEFLGRRTDVLDLLQQSWGFVLPSRWEGMSNALLEAMACGLPCIATRISGSEDVICHGVDGLLVAPEQPAALAEALRRVIEDAEVAQRLGAAARAKVVRDYQLTHVVEQCVAVYRCLLARHGEERRR
ncbi:MAG TPA: glycosyltransferase family 4 protein [Chloroflexota bacterium]|nr:glycosyltransferase family 4 protein [Chloroflexota bacterium]